MNTHALDHHSASACPNCGAAVSGNFCQQCGQETVLHPPSIAEFLHEFIGHYVALEGKLWQTLKLLVLKPGALTAEYMAGRRVRYIQPLRVYLTFSLVFFALFKFIGHDHQIGGFKIKGMPAVQMDQEFKPQDHADLRAQLDSQAEFKRLKATHPFVTGFGERLADSFTDDDGRKLTAGFFSYAPYAVFALMPIFAIFLNVLYLGARRRYGEHLLFALHTNAFAFLTLSVLIMIPEGVPLIGNLLFLWLVIYLPLAMRRVYGGGYLITFVRWAVLMALHLVSMLAAIAVVFYGASGH